MHNEVRNEERRINVGDGNAQPEGDMPNDCAWVETAQRASTIMIEAEMNAIVIDSVGCEWVKVR